MTVARASAPTRAPVDGDAHAGANPGRTDVRWRLGAGTRKGVLLVHLASAGAWLASTW